MAMKTVKIEKSFSEFMGKDGLDLELTWEKTKVVRFQSIVYTLKRYLNSLQQYSSITSFLTAVKKEVIVKLLYLFVRYKNSLDNSFNKSEINWIPDIFSSVGTRQCLVSTTEKIPG